MENINTIVIKKISPAETLKSIAVGETRLIKSKAIKENVVRATMSRLNKIGYNFISKSGVDGWKSHSTLTLLATQNYPFWLKYD